MQIIQAPSPNFNDRRFPLDMLVLHYTGMGTSESALKRMCDEDAQVSAHYMVDEYGRIFQLVAEDKRAWHAGVSVWQGDEDLNSRSIGIEIANGGHNVPTPDGGLPPYPPQQIEAVITLCQAILERHDIPQTRVVGHSDIAPDRKDDPGEHFPWQLLSDAGVGLWPDAVDPASVEGEGLSSGATGPMVSRLQQSLTIIGYGIDDTGTYDDRTEAVVRAFQRRWNQRHVTGEADLLTMALIDRVALLAANLAIAFE